MRIQHLVSLLAVFLLGLTGCASPTLASITPTAMPPTSVPTAAPPTNTPTTVPPTAAPTPTEPVPGGAAFPNLGTADIFGSEQPAGLYKSPDPFSIPFIFETNDDYRGMYEGFSQAQIFGLAQGGANFPPKQILFWAIDPDYSVDQAISQLRTTQNMAGTEVRAAQVDGISSTQFDATAENTLAIPALAEFVGHAGDSWKTNSPSVHLRFIALPVSERTLLIYIEAPQEEWDSFITDVEQILGTIKFAP